MSGIFEDSAQLRAVGEPSEGSPGSVPLTVIEPEGVGRGGIVVLHEARDFPPAFLDLMRSLADEGWVAVAPHLFHREPAHSTAEVFGDNLFSDFDAAFDWLVRRGVYEDCIGVLGFDDAGTAAFLVATTRRIGAAVSVAAPGIVEPIAEDATALVHAASSLQVPWLGLYGEADPAIPLDHVEQLRDAAGTADVAALVVSYSGLAHRADQPPQVPGSEDEPLAEAILDAQRRIFDWFDSNLR